MIKFYQWTNESKEYILLIIYIPCTRNKEELEQFKKTEEFI